MTDHLIAKRNRVRDMLLDQENNQWLIYTEEQLRAVLTDDNLALMNVEILHSRDIRKLELEQRRAGREWAEVFPNAISYDERLQQARNTVGNANRKLVYWNEKLEEAQSNIKVFTNQVAESKKDVANAWAKLTDQERMFYGPTPINPIGVYDFPGRDRYGMERAVFYPEPTIHHQAQTAKLRHALEVVERELAEREGKS